MIHREVLVVKKISHGPNIVVTMIEKQYENRENEKEKEEAKGLEEQEDWNKREKDIKVKDIKIK